MTAAIVTTGAVFLISLFIMQIAIIRKTPDQEKFQKLIRLAEETYQYARVAERISDSAADAARSAYRATCDVHKAVTTGNANTELVAAVSAVAHGMSESTYKVFLELVTAVETNDVGRLSGVVRSAKHMCSQYEAAELAKLPRSRQKGGA